MMDNKMKIIASYDLKEIYRIRGQVDAMMEETELAINNAPTKEEADALREKQKNLRATRVGLSILIYDALGI